MKKLYLVTGTMFIDSYYAREGVSKPVNRLVWAPDEDEACRILSDACNKSDPYGTTIRVCDAEAHEALGTPDDGALRWTTWPTFGEDPESGA